MDGYLASWVQHFQAVARQLGRWVSGWNDASALQYFLLGVLSRPKFWCKAQAQTRCGIDNDRHCNTWGASQIGESVTTQVDLQSDMQSSMARHHTLDSGGV